MQFDLSGYQNPDGSPQAPEEELGFWGTAADATVFAIGRGIAGAAEGVYDLADWALQDWLPDAEDNFGMGHSKTLMGGLVQGISQFMVGFVPGMWGVGHLGKLSGLTGVGLKAGKIGKAAQAAKAAGKAKTAKAIKYSAQFGKATAAGAVADFAVFDAQEHRLSNLIQQFPSLQNPVTEFLAADEGDSEAEGRLKNLIEGGILGAMSEPFIMGLRSLRNARKAKAAGGNPDEALQKSWEAEQTRQSEVAQDLSPDAISRQEEPAPLPTSEDLDRFFDIPAEPKKIPPYSDDYPVPKGVEEMKARINREVSQGELTSGEAQFANNLIDRLNQQGGIDNTGIRFRTAKNLGGENVAGTYDFVRRVVSIATQTVEDGRFKRTFTHEIWHALEEVVDPKQLEAMTRDLAKARKSFAKQHGLDYDEMFQGRTGEATDAFQKFVAKEGIAKDEWYRLTNSEEWMAENMADATFKRLDLEADTKSLIGFMRYTFQNLLTEIKSTFGRGTYDKVARGFLEGRYVQPSSVKPTRMLDASSISGRFKPVAADISEEALPVQSTGASKKLTEYEARLEKEHGSDWLNKATPGQRRHHKGLLNKQAQVPNNARTPGGRPYTDQQGVRRYKEGGHPFNLNRLSDIEGVDAMLDAQVRTGSKEFQDELANVAKMSHDDVRVKAEEINDELATLGARRFSKKELETFDSTGQLSEVVAKQNLLRNYHQQFVNEANKLAEKVASGSAEDEVRFLLMQQRAETVGVLVKRNQEKIAQALGAQRIQGTDMLPSRDLIPEEVLDGADPKFIDDVLKEVGGGDATRGRANVQKMAKRYIAVKNTQSEAAASKFLQDRAKYSEMLVEYWINSILSGPITHMVNMTSNTLNTLFLPLEQTFGHLASFQFKQAGEALGMYVHLGSQFQDAMSAASGAFKNWGDDLDQLGVVDTKQGYKRTISSESLPGLSNTIGGASVNWIGKALNIPSRFLMAEDAFFKHLNYRAEVRKGLFDEGRAAGKVGAELSSHVEEGLEKMIVDGQHYTYKAVRLSAERRASDEVSKMGIKDIGERQMAMKKLTRKYMDEDWNRHVDPDTGENARSVLAQKALQYGRDVTYTRALDDPDRSKLVKAAGEYNNLVNKVPLMRMITPFVRTPTNLLSFYLNRTAGAYIDLAKMGYRGSVKHMKAANKEMADAVAKGGPTKADVLGRFATGNMLMFGTGMAFHAGSITGGGPSDPARRRQLEATGWQPYSIRVGDEWLSYRRFDPFASFLGTVADFNEALAESDPEDQDTFDAMMGAIVNTAARNVTNKSYLTGMARISNVLSNPDRYGSAYIESTMASMMPFSSLAGQTIGASEHEKEVRGVVDAIRTKYGLTSETDLAALGITTRVEDRRNLFGEKVEKPGLLSPFPIHYTEIKDDMVMEELAVLGRQNAFSPPSKIANAIDLTESRNSRGQSMYDRWLELHGTVRIGGRTLRQSMKDLIKSRRYQQLAVEDLEGIESPRVGELRKLIRRYRALAKQEALKEFPEVRALDKRNTQIKQYRKAGRDIQPLLDY